MTSFRLINYHTMQMIKELSVFDKHNKPAVVTNTLKKTSANKVPFLIYRSLCH